MELFSISEAAFVCRAHCLCLSRPWMFYLRAIATGFNLDFPPRAGEEQHVPSAQTEEGNW